MATPSSLAIIAAANDTNLLNRAVAIAALLGALTPDYDVQRLRREVMIVPLDEAGNTVAGVYEYATAHREMLTDLQERAIQAAIAANPIPPEPGLDPSAVTDDQIEAALTALITAKKMTASMPPETAPAN